MSYGLNVEMHKQVMHPHIIIQRYNDIVKNVWANTEKKWKSHYILDRCFLLQNFDLNWSVEFILSSILIYLFNNVSNR